MFSLSFSHSLTKYYLQVTSWGVKVLRPWTSGSVFIPPSYPVCLKIQSKVENTSLRSLKAFFHFSSCILSVVLPGLCFSTVLLRNFCCHFYSSHWICNLFISSLFSESLFLSRILCHTSKLQCGSTCAYWPTCLMGLVNMETHVLQFCDFIDQFLWWLFPSISPSFWISCDWDIGAPIQILSSYIIKG